MKAIKDIIEDYINGEKNQGAYGINDTLFSFASAINEELNKNDFYRFTYEKDNKSRTVSFVWLQSSTKLDSWGYNSPVRVPLFTVKISMNKGKTEYRYGYTYTKYSVKSYSLYHSSVPDVLQMDAMQLVDAVRIKRQEVRKKEELAKEKAKNESLSVLKGHGYESFVQLNQEFANLFQVLNDLDYCERTNAVSGLNSFLNEKFGYRFNVKA